MPLHDNSLGAERWLVISNCQTHGYANSLQSLAPEVEVFPLYAHTFLKKQSLHNKMMSSFDRLFISKGIERLIPRAKLDLIPQHVQLPWFGFRAYHPDLVYVQDSEGNRVKGPADDYHSALVLAAYAKGLRQADVVKLFRRDVFQACGYFELWEPERDRVSAHVAEAGIDISGSWGSWGKHDAFMYSINHPKIRVLHGISRKILTSIGLNPQQGALLPADNLAYASGFAIYPEIGENLGVDGAYLFKTYDTYRQFGLEEFIAGCFHVYDTFAAGSLRPVQEFEFVVERANQAI